MKTDALTSTLECASPAGAGEPRRQIAEAETIHRGDFTSQRLDQPISALLATRQTLRSIELFPPKDEAGVAALRETAAALQSLHPDFVSVTYGAGGGTRERTAQVSGFLRRDFGFTVMPHLTCVGHSRGELVEIADQIHANGFRNIMTLRGDPPRGETSFTPPLDGLRFASDLVALLKARHPDFCLGVGGYPERHPEAVSEGDDLIHLKRKVDAGADFITTQLFLDNAVYHRFVDRCRHAGITVPIIPGIMPVLSLQKIQRFGAMCGVAIPAQLVARLEAAADDTATVEAIGIEWAVSQIRDLLTQGAPGYHLYILNRAAGAHALVEGLVA